MLPKSLVQIIDQFDVQELHLSLTKVRVAVFFMPAEGRGSTSHHMRRGTWYALAEWYVFFCPSSNRSILRWNVVLVVILLEGIREI